MFKHVMASIRKNKFIGLIFIFQIVIAIVGLAQISYYNDYFNYFEKNAKEFNLPIENMYTTKYGGGIFDYSKNNGFIEDLKKSLGEESIGVFLDTDLETLGSKDNFSDIKYINNIQITDSIYNLMGLEIIKGRGFNKEEFKKEYTKKIPVIVSEEYLDTINLGDEIKTTYGEDYIETFEVVGFFKKDSKWFSRDFLNAEAKNLNNTFISVLNYKSGNPHINNLFSNLYLFNTTGYSNEQFKNIIKVLEDKHSEVLYTKSVKEIIDEEREINKQSIISTIVIGVTLITFTLFSIGLVSFYSLKNRKGEIGLMKVVGAKTKRIKFIILLEWSIYLFTSLGLSIVVTYFNNKVDLENLKDNLMSVTNLAKMSYSSVFLIWLGITIIAIIIVYISSSKIIDKQVTELIKGVE
ncbi:MAG: FtsX-like permease family protein [Clostridium chrysemydis]|uniref:ABC transporter permease n=1 Tax=Clostridium chrysemydis TaxID=2665504 RepID=UPI003F3326DB